MKQKIVLFLSVILLGSFYAAKAQDCPPNMDFELGTTAVWNYFTGTCCPISTPTSTGAIVGRHTLTSGATLDAYGGFPIVAPGGGLYSLKLGNNGTGSQSEKARYYIHVPIGVSNYSIIYRYAIVLQDGGSGHTGLQQPRFDVNAFDSATGAPVSCAQYHFVASSSIPGFLTSATPGATDVRYKSWTTASINLSGLGGSTVQIDFASGDCSLGGHFGYGYLDMSCGLFQITAVGCDDTVATLTGPDGFSTYTWYDSATFTTVYGSTQTITIPMPATATTYAVILQPFTGFGCPDTLYTRVRPSHLQLYPSNDTALCFGNPITITTGATDIALPLTYSWSPAAGLSCTSCATPVATPTVNTTYVFTVTNDVGCFKTDSITITGGHVVIDPTFTNPSCFGYANGTATATPVIGTAPYMYNWNSSPPQSTSTATNLPIGTYTVSVTDATGCTGDTTVTLTQPPQNILSLDSSHGPTTCLGTDGIVYLSGLSPGFSFTINYTFNGVPSSTGVTASATGTAVLTGFPAGVFSTIGVAILPGPGFSGTHCPYNSVGPDTLRDPNNPAIPFVGSNSPICEGATLSLTGADATAGVSFSWTGPNGFSSILQNPSIVGATLAATGTYVLTVMINNCFASGSTNVVIKPLPQPLASNNTPICQGDTIKLTSSSGNGADFFSWSGPPAYSSNSQNPVISGAQVSSSGTYTVTILLNGCTAQTTTYVTVNPTPAIPGVVDTDYCQFATAIPLHAVGTNLLWFTSLTGVGSPIAPLPSTLVPGNTTWYVNQTSAEGCVGPLTPIRVRVVHLEHPYATITDSVICKGTHITFVANETGEDNSGITWNFGTGDSIMNVNPVIYSFDSAGVFTVIGNVYYNVCADVSLVKTITVIPYPYLYIGEDTTICPGSSIVNLWDHNNSGSSTATWLWNTGETTSGIYVTTPGVYYVTVSDNNCPSSDTVTILNDCYMNVPNGFTPNGDGVNDFFMPRQYLTRGLTAFKMQIFNRWGELVFETTRIDGGGWDGKFNNTPQPEGVFIYNIEAKFKDGGNEQHHGNFTLLR